MRMLEMTEAIFLLTALQWTIFLSLGALAGGAAGGLLIALARTSMSRWLQYISYAVVVLFQGTPLLLQLFLVFFGLGVFGYNVNPWFAALLTLSLHASAFLGEIWRGSIVAVPRGQWEAGRALSLSYPVLMSSVILPQAAKIALPPTVGFTVQLIKATSLTAIIGFTELTRAAQILNNNIFEPLLIFSSISLLYFLLCWPLSQLGRKLENRLAAGTSTRQSTVANSV